MSGRHLASYLYDAASLWGERPACADAARIYSYNDYLNEALRVAALLRRAGVEAGDRVCISAPKSFSLYASIFGTLMLNACYVPIDYTVPAGRGRKIIADCAPAAIITTARNLERLLDSPVARSEHIAEDLIVAPIGTRPPLPANEMSGLPPAARQSRSVEPGLHPLYVGLDRRAEGRGAYASERRRLRRMGGRRTRASTRTTSSRKWLPSRSISRCSTCSALSRAAAQLVADP